jgi:hypothetical protein
MTDAAEPAVDGQTTAEQAALAAGGGATAAPAAVFPPTASGGSPADERPELAVGAAFAGGLAIALLLKRLAR